MSPDTNETREQWPGIADKVAFLTRPEIYPTVTCQVHVVETHFSWVFLTDSRVYKLKKPICAAFLDFRTLEARRLNCEEEVRLNRRLAANVYFGTVPLTLDGQGNMHLMGPGDPIDWLVSMRRLPAARMLDYAIVHGTVQEADVRQLGALLARFYRQAPVVDLTPAAYRQHLRESVHATQRELLLPLYALPADRVAAVGISLLTVLERAPDRFDQRAQAKRIVEAHGDLRPEHICLEAPPVIIDCLEFHRDLRRLDPVSELAFLTLECARLGAPGIGERVLQIYSEATGDQPSETLVTFYWCFHAYHRAKIAVWHLKEPECRDPAKWRSQAKHYLQLACRIRHQGENC